MDIFTTRMYAIWQRTREKLDEVGGQFGIATRFTDFEELIRDPEVDAIHKLESITGGNVSERLGYPPAVCRRLVGIT